MRPVTGLLRNKLREQAIKWELKVTVARKKKTIERAAANGFENAKKTRQRHESRCRFLASPGRSAGTAEMAPDLAPQRSRRDQRA